MTTKAAIFLSILPFVLLLASVAAFLLYVPAMTVVTTFTIVLALGLTFMLGMLAGGRRIRISRMRRQC